MSIQNLFPLPSGEIDYDILVGFSACQENILRGARIERDNRGNAFQAKHMTKYKSVVGGTSFDIAYAMSQTFGKKPFLVYSVAADGNEPARQFIVPEITNIGIASHPLPCRHGSSIGTVIIEDGLDPIIWSSKPGYNTLPTNTIEDLVKKNDPSIIIMSGIMPEEVELAEAAFIARPEAIKILNPRQELIAERSLFARLCFQNPFLSINHQELSIFLGKRIPENGVTQDHLQILHDALNVDKIIVTCNECGAIFSAHEKSIWHPTPVRRFGEPVDKTGAGDAFLSGVVAAILADVPSLEEMMRWGATMAGLKVLHTGGASVPSPKEFKEAL